jgi:hypothetical protein
MRSLPFVVSLLLLAVPAHADAHSKHRDSKHASHVEHAKHVKNVERRQPVYFSRGDQRVIREYYAPRYRTLPPGLQKKYYRTGQLPPGWQRKLQPMPVVVERRLAPIPPYYRRGVIDGHAVVYDPRRHEIIDVTPVRR